jgi:hypothetical protein
MIAAEWCPFGQPHACCNITCTVMRDVPPVTTLAIRGLYWLYRALAYAGVCDLARTKPCSSAAIEPFSRFR